jgi:hypothetical protein
MSQTDVEPDNEVQTNTPRWVKRIGIVAILLVLLIIILHLTGNSLSNHGNHTSLIETQQP